MGRWRPPPEKSSPYITAAGADKLKTDLASLWHLRRSDVVPALSAAAAEGDRSENAEYIYRKKQLGEIDRKIRYISKRLEEIKVVDGIPSNQEKVYFGALIDIEDEQGEVNRYRIVGADETDATRGYISIDSPLARAFMGKEQGDEVNVELPGGMALLILNRVHYGK